ncbi:hypothetical protein ACXWTF_01385 [Thiomicrolovo sp. ZZH C-3]
MDKVTLVSDANAYYEIMLGEGAEPEPAGMEYTAADTAEAIPEEAVDLGGGRYIIYGPDVSADTGDIPEVLQPVEPEPDQIVKYGPVVSADVEDEAELLAAALPDPDQRVEYGPDVSGDLPDIQ